MKKIVLAAMVMCMFCAVASGAEVRADLPEGAEYTLVVTVLKGFIMPYEPMPMVPVTLTVEGKEHKAITDRSGMAEFKFESGAKSADLIAAPKGFEPMEKIVQLMGPKIEEQFVFGPLPPKAEK